MFRYLRALWYICTGRFSAAAESLQSNKYVMEATYDRSIAKSGERFQTVKDAVAKLMSIEATRMVEVKDLTAKAEKLEKIKVGAQTAMQKQIDVLRRQNPGLSKEELQQKAQSDPEFIKHSGNYKDAASSLDQTHQQIADKEADLKERQAQIAKYKLELQGMQKNHEKLRQEKTEAVADVAIAQQAQQIADVLSGIAEDTTDKDLAAVREARKNAQAKAKITAELSGNDAHIAESEYLQLASNKEADKELDNLLNWGEEETTAKMEDAKLTE